MLRRWRFAQMRKAIFCLMVLLAQSLRADLTEASAYLMKSFAEGNVATVPLWGECGQRTIGTTSAAASFSCHFDPVTIFEPYELTWEGGDFSASASVQTRTGPYGLGIFAYASTTPRVFYVEPDNYGHLEPIAEASASYMQYMVATGASGSGFLDVLLNWSDIVPGTSLRVVIGEIDCSPYVSTVTVPVQFGHAFPVSFEAWKVSYGGEMGYDGGGVTVEVASVSFRDANGVPVSAALTAAPEPPPPVTVPEPLSVILLATSCLGLFAVRRQGAKDVRPSSLKRLT
jgi:hypothetical protein